MDRPLVERKAILKQELQENDLVTIIDYLQGDGEAYFKAALQRGLEGIMAKRLASPYQPGVRSRDWVKIKRHLTLDLVVGGYMLGQGQREPFFGSLLVGAYDSGKLVYMGRVGSGSRNRSWKRYPVSSGHQKFLRFTILLTGKMCNG